MTVINPPVATAAIELMIIIIQLYHVIPAYLSCDETLAINSGRVLGNCGIKYPPMFLIILLTHSMLQAITY